MIEVCVPDNVDLVLNLGHEWADEMQVPDYDHESWLRYVRKYSIYDNACCLLLRNNENQAVGFIIGGADQVPHTGEIVSQIHYIFVKQRFFEHLTMRELTQAFESWAQKIRAVSVVTPSAYYLPEEYQEFFQESGYQTGTSVMAKGLV